MKRKKVQWLSDGVLAGYNDFEYLLYKIYFHSAPTILGGKPSTLMAFNCKGRNMAAIWDQHRQLIEQYLPLTYREINRNDKGVVVLFYKEATLLKHMRQEEEAGFLGTYGYGLKNLSSALDLLSKRFKQGCPHEMGVLLGYPVKDVQTYIKNQQQPCPLIGYWKAYHNLEAAYEIFCHYDLTRNHVLDLLKQGHAPSKLKRLIAA